MVSPLNIGRAVGALGSSIPVVGDILTMGYIRKHAGKAKGIGAKQGWKVFGGPMMVVGWGITANEAYKAGWRVGQRKVAFGSGYVRLPRFYKASQSSPTSGNSSSRKEASEVTEAVLPLVTSVQCATLLRRACHVSA